MKENYAAPAWRVLQLWCMKHILEVPADTLMNTWPKDRLEELLPENWTDDTI